ncbi:TnsA endonuclease N-terminal domain-containing protein [Delftia sp. UGAL515B_04]|uniref:TnsA endonuclease N-terminal domain-containing protein n=1 Tax=Delftia sp. UGAL515B_04 TaxID=2986766 RepID=UPI00295577F8|nr:TnsA endonuclease N-terminal domain-containing protein [Delftia sp. UGAL515B_04]WON90865.1 TnsA endonuclease N-terminal domain-containing protein [Delftia sp. UGAL515B_04]
MRTEKRFTPTVLERFSKEGRGTGTYADYTPWHRVSRGDPSSIGRSHLIVWRDRQRELLSDQEWSGLNFAGLVPNLVDLTEQFPLSQDSSSHELSRWHVGFETNQFPGTREIAEMLGIRHPQLSSGDQSRHWTSTTDLLLVLQSERGLLELLAISCKPSEIISTRSKELLMLEKTYWAQRGVSWLLITPNQYDANVSLTLRRTSPWGYADPASQAEIDIACQVVRSEPWLPFSDVIQSITSHLGGETISIARKGHYGRQFGGVFYQLTSAEAGGPTILSLLFPERYFLLSIPSWHGGLHAFNT